MTDPKECGADMGGIWIPQPKGGSTVYTKLFCNRPLHLVGEHAYLDPKSGMLVKQVLEPKVVIEKDRISRAPR